MKLFELQHKAAEAQIKANEAQIKAIESQVKVVEAQNAALRDTQYDKAAALLKGQEEVYSAQKKLRRLIDQRNYMFQFCLRNVATITSPIC